MKIKINCKLLGGHCDCQGEPEVLWKEGCRDLEPAPAGSEYQDYTKKTDG